MLIINSLFTFIMLREKLGPLGTNSMQSIVQPQLEKSESGIQYGGNKNT